MNMKKTIAAVAACAVAVSAMATTVSADTNTLHYNLVNTVYKNTGSATITATVSKLDTTTATSVVLQAPTFTNLKGANLGYGNTTYTITGYNFDDATGAKSDAFSFVVTSKSATWSLNASNWVDDAGKITIPVTTSASTGIVAGNTYITVTAVVSHADTGWTDNANKDLLAGGFTVNAGAGAVAMATTLTAYTSASEAIDAQYPMMTDANTSTIGIVNGVYGSNGAVDNRVGVWGEVREFYNKGDYTNHATNVYGSASNIIAYLQDPTYNLNGNGKSYYNVAAVLNDIISNYDDVTFTFNTAAKGVSEVRKDVKDSTGAVIDKNAVVAYKYDDNGDKKYTAFGQHLYNLYGDEASTYVYSGYDWTGYNLFSGALVINGSLSMSLNNTEVFDYAATSLSFNWEDVTGGANVNTYVTYLQKMQLATSATWFWDSMDVVYGNTESDDVNSGEGTDAEEDVIADDTADEEIADDTAADEEPADEEVPAEDEAPADEAPAEEAPAANPATGNAPIALAVIPVALAAAAVVAKKRG